MAEFIWVAKTRNGEEKKGEMEADSADAVTQRLRAQGMQVEKVKKKPFDIVLRMPGDTGVTTKELVIFTRQFATMIDAGLPLVQCLDLLGNQADNPVFKKIVLDVKSSVESGQTLAESLGKHPKIFDKLYVNLVAAGETAGVLDTILNRLGEYIEQNMRLMKQIKSAMTYPITVLVVSFVVTIVLLVFVIPTFEKMFADFGAELPGITQAVIDMSDFVQDHIVIILGTAAFLKFGSQAALATTRGRNIFDAAILKAPVFGPLVRKIAVAKFTRTMGTMLASGVPILDALEIVAATAGNNVVERGLLMVRAKIAEGKTMAEPLSQLPIFPSMVVQMIAVGEQAGAMDTMLNKIADFYDEEVDDAVGVMMALLEPIIMSFLAVVLGGLVISMYLPVFTMAGAVGG